MTFLRKPALPAHLRTNAFTDALPTAELRQLDRIGTLVDIDEGTTIIAEATFGRECFVIADGEFAVTSTTIEAAVGAGELAGELSLLTGHPRNASVAATTDAVVYALHPQEFATLMSQAPRFRSQVVATANARLKPALGSTPEHFTHPAGSARAPREPSATWSARLADAPSWQSS